MPDEIFKGTNTIERISAGKEVLSVLKSNKYQIQKIDILEKTNKLLEELTNKQKKLHEEINKIKQAFKFKVN